MKWAVWDKYWNVCEEKKMHFTNLMTHAIRIARTMARDEAVAKSRSADHGGSLPSPRSTSTSTLHRDGGKLRQHFGRGLLHELLHLLEQGVEGAGPEKPPEQGRGDQLE